MSGFASEPKKRMREGPIFRPGLHLFVDLVNLCSSNSVLPLTPGQLRALATPGAELATVEAFEPYGIGQRLGEDNPLAIIGRYESGETAQALADEFDVSKSALLNLLRRNNVVVRRRALTDDQVTDLARACQAGKTIASLEIETGIPHGTIQRALKNAGVHMRPRGFQPTS